jgi:hypothetical protein
MSYQHNQHVKKKEFVYYYYVHLPLPSSSIAVVSLEIICKIKDIKTVLIQIGTSIIKTGKKLS